jgi:hypothetical protein
MRRTRGGLESLVLFALSAAICSVTNERKRRGVFRFAEEHTRSGAPFELGDAAIDDLILHCFAPFADSAEHASK